MRNLFDLYFTPPSTNLHPLPTPLFAMNPAGTSSAYAAAPRERYERHGSALQGSIVSALMNAPCVPKKRISSGTSVFFIQKESCCGRVKVKSIPPVTLRRNMRPRARAAGVLAISTVSVTLLSVGLRSVMVCSGRPGRTQKK